jgi:hypothetical protein
VNQPAHALPALGERMDNCQPRFACRTCHRNHLYHSLLHDKLRCSYIVLPIDAKRSFASSKENANFAATKSVKLRHGRSIHGNFD